MEKEKNLVNEAMKKVSSEVKESPKTEQAKPQPQVTNVVNKPITPTVTIKFRGLKTVVERKIFVNVQEAPDGLIFNFANGMHLVYSNQHLHSANKIRVTAATNAFLGSSNTTGSLIIDLDNLNKPVRVNL
jgi:hypothetical protein